MANIGKGCHKKTFTGKHSFTCTHKFSQKSLLLPSSVTENCFHLYAFVHHHKSAGFSNGCFIWVKFYFHALHFFAADQVIYFMVSSCGCIHFSKKILSKLSVRKYRFHNKIINEQK